MCYSSCRIRGTLPPSVMLLVTCKITQHVIRCVEGTWNAINSSLHGPSKSDFITTIAEALKKTKENLRRSLSTC